MARDALVALTSQADGDLKKAQGSIERWFDDGMDRVSGWYKRKTQTIIFLVGLLVGVALNADTFAIAENLARDKTMRDAIASRATDIVKDRSLDTRERAADTKEKSGEGKDAPLEKAKTLISGNMTLPLGWSRPGATPEGSGRDAACGFLMTGAAVSLGAPFWFDVLSKVSNLRSAGRPPGKTSGEGSSDG